MEADVSIFKFTVRFKDTRVETFYVVGHLGICKSKYFDGLIVCRIVDDFINTMEYGQGEFNKDFFLVSYKEIGQVLKLRSNEE